MYLSFSGSETLSRWQRLATPTLGGVPDRRCGVQVRGDSTGRSDEDDYSTSQRTSNQPVGSMVDEATATAAASQAALSSVAPCNEQLLALADRALSGIIQPAVARHRSDTLKHRFDTPNIARGPDDVDTGLNTAMDIKRLKRWYSHNAVIDRWKVMDLLTSCNTNTQTSACVTPPATPSSTLFAASSSGPTNCGSGMALNTLSSNDISGLNLYL